MKFTEAVLRTGYYLRHRRSWWRLYRFADSRREKAVYLANPEMQPELDNHEYAVGRQLKPEARMDIIYELADLKIRPTSMIDVSDGPRF